MVKPQTTLVESLDLYHSLDRFDSARRETIRSIVNETFLVDVCYESHEPAYAYNTDQRFRNGQSLIGVIAGTSHKVTVQLPSERNDEISECAKNDVVQVVLSPTKWEGVYDRLSCIAVLDVEPVVVAETSEEVDGIEPDDRVPQAEDTNPPTVNDRDVEPVVVAEASEEVDGIEPDDREPQAEDTNTTTVGDSDVEPVVVAEVSEEVDGIELDDRELQAEDTNTTTVGDSDVEPVVVAKAGEEVDGIEPDDSVVDDSVIVVDAIRKDKHLEVEPDVKAETQSDDDSVEDIFASVGPPKEMGMGSETIVATSRMAVASMVLGLLSMVCCMCTGIPATVLGTIALIQISRSNGRLKGTGFAVTGLVFGVVFTILSLIMALLLPAVESAPAASDRLVRPLSLSVYPPLCLPRLSAAASDRLFRPSRLSRDATRRMQCTNQIKQLDLSLLKYHQATQHFPAHAIRQTAARVASRHPAV